MNTKFNYEYFHSLIKSGEIDAAFDYRASFTPEYIYKFYPLADNPVDEQQKQLNQKRLYSLENEMIWFASPEKQNDPYEFKGIYWDDNKLLQIGIPQQSIEYTKELLFKRILLAAFTSNVSDNLSMWAHYANNHHGYCVKYKVGNKRTIRNVIYSSNRTSMTNTFINFLQQGFRGFKLGDVKLIEESQKLSAILQDKFFYKHTSWEYENEFRALYPFDGTETGLNVSIAEISLSVEEIYSGINCSEENKKELSRIASKLKVPYKECSMSDVDFTVFRNSKKV